MTTEDFTSLFALFCILAAGLIGILIFVSPLIIIGRLGQIIELLKKLNDK